MTFYSVICYDFVHENVGNPALNTRQTVLTLFVHFCYFRDSLVKISGYECEKMALK
jgi:hypothetical protein